MHGTRASGKVHYRDKGKETPSVKVQKMLQNEEALKASMADYINNIRTSINSKLKGC